MTENKHLIWDMPLRLFHWLLVACFAVLWATAELGSDYMQYHMYAGYFMLGLLAFRLVWGFVGTTHSKFSAFFPTPSKVKQYLGGHHKPPGHNPLGALMVFAMLLLLLGQAISGLFISDEVFTSGPYASEVSGVWKKLFNGLHEWCFTLLQLAVLLHLLAIIFYKLVKKQNLIIAMLTGRKSAMHVSASDSIKHSKLLIAAILAVAVAAFVYWLVVVNAPQVEEFYYY